MNQSWSTIRRSFLVATFFASLVVEPNAGYAQSVAPPAMSALSTAPSIPAAGQDGDSALRERVAKLEERLATQRRDADRMEADLGKLKDQHDELVTFKNNAFFYLSGAATVIVALFGSIVAFFYSRLKQRIEKDGGPKAIVDAVMEKLYAEDAAKFTRLFEQHRNELARVIMARDQPIAFVGEHEDSELIKDMLKRVGYDHFVDDTAKAKLAIVFCESETFGDLVDKLLEEMKANRLPRRLVLYSAGGKHLNSAKVRDLNTWATAIAANMPATAATQLATLAALGQSVK